MPLVLPQHTADITNQSLCPRSLNSSTASFSAGLSAHRALDTDQHRVPGPGSPDRAGRAGLKSTPATDLPVAWVMAALTQDMDMTACPPATLRQTPFAALVAGLLALDHPRGADARPCQSPGPLPGWPPAGPRGSYHPQPCVLTLIADEAGPALGAVTAIQAWEAGPPIPTVVTREAAVLAEGGVQADWGRPVGPEVG